MLRCQHIGSFFAGSVTFGRNTLISGSYTTKRLFNSLQQVIVASKISGQRNRKNLLGRMNQELHSHQYSLRAREQLSQGNDALVNQLIKTGIIGSQKVVDTMRAIDRFAFLPRSQQVHSAYEDSPQVIYQGGGYSATISAPHMHAKCLEYLQPYLNPESKVLDVGSGSGYLTVALAHLAQTSGNGRVIGIEHVPELCQHSRACIQNVPYAKELYDQQLLQIHECDGRYGYEEYAPYDAIHVGAAAEKVPFDLVDQLASNGCMVIPIGEAKGRQQLVKVTKDANGQIATEALLDVRYVPLTSVTQY